MLYRVDYQLAILFAGFVVGVLLSRSVSKFAPSRLAQAYYSAVALLLVLRTGAFVCSLLAHQPTFWNSLGGIIGDLGNALFGALFGLATRRRGEQNFLRDKRVVDALCMTLAFTFGMASIGKAFSFAPMTEFFTQSGYSVAFLKFIVIAELFAAIGLLLPWAFLPAAIGLTIDMFGAVVTHVHNGDPLNDSTGAIAVLIRLLAVGVLWALPRGEEKTSSSSLGRTVAGVGTVAAICLMIAIGGSAAIRHLSASPKTAALLPKGIQPSQRKSEPEHRRWTSNGTSASGINKSCIPERAYADRA